ncbi:hypothetical protein O6B42_05695 [Campylobacter ureolyticus]|uniref:hypothetical protein n=1 Tax=Campylobacter ureolyticus TaxID=827 RepID=UPI0022B53FFB|nr:hypothetical protein [Campylobacter ureolyticus]MCZ6133375.1 hypothetical protein [Campylobacter ureolyticus]
MMNTDYDFGQINLNKVEKEKIGGQFLDFYLNSGFGVLNKTDIEISLFYFLKKNKFKDSLNYEISNFLKIPESRVKRLDLNSTLRFENVDREKHIKILKNIFIKFLEKSSSLKENQKIVLILEKDIEKRELEFELKSRFYTTAEYGLNGEILKVEPIKFLKLMVEIFSNDKNIDIKDYCKKIIKKQLQDEADIEKIIFESMPLREKTLNLLKNGYKFVVDGELESIINFANLLKTLLCIKR